MRAHETLERAGRHGGFPACGSASGLPRAIDGGGPMMHLILVIAVVFVLAASYLLTFALCRAATRRDMLEARWREESAGSVSEESHESA